MYYPDSGMQFSLEYVRCTCTSRLCLDPFTPVFLLSHFLPLLNAANIIIVVVVVAVAIIMSDFCTLRPATRAIFEIRFNFAAKKCAFGSLNILINRNRNVYLFSTWFSLHFYLLTSRKILSDKIH